MPQSSDVQLVPADNLAQWASQVFEHVGMPAEDARQAADVLINTSLRGVDSHGIVRLPLYVSRIQSGTINPRPNLKATETGPAVTLLDGDGGLGLVIGARAMELAIAQARQAGGAFVGVRNSGHFGAGAYYALMAAAVGMIGLSMSNTGPIMPAWGSIDMSIGNNPLAFAAPGGIVVDMATSQVAWSKVMLAARNGEKIPLTWATDREGRPTDDAVVGMNGMMQPVGGYKGYALAVMIEVLCSALTGAEIGPRIGDDEKGIGHFFVAIDIERFTPIEEFQERITQLVNGLHASRPVKGVEQVLAPGERAARVMAERRQSGIPLAPDVVHEFTQLGNEVSIPFSL